MALQRDGWLSREGWVAKKRDGWLRIRNGRLEEGRVI